MDIVADLLLKTVTVDEADRQLQSTVEAIHQGRASGGWAEQLGLSSAESTAMNWGGSWQDLMWLRKNGWPTACALCGLPLDYRHDAWRLAHALNGIPVLEHASCPTSERQYKHMEDWYGAAITGDFNYHPFWLELISAAESSKLQTRWSIGPNPTIASLISIRGRWLVVQHFEGGVRDGQIAAAYPPTAQEIGAMLMRVER